MIHITDSGREVTIDAGPSDALAFSLRINAPFVSEGVMKKSQKSRIHSVIYNRVELIGL